MAERKKERPERQAAEDQAVNGHSPATEAEPAQAQEPPAAEQPDASPDEELAAALEAARGEAANLKDQLLRALAETENVRRRAQREREDASRFAIAAFARDLLPVADNLRRALDNIAAEARAADPALEALAAGVEMTERLLLNVFEKYNLRRIEPVGERFDSNLHQAMFEVAGSGQPAGTVVQLLEPGYLLHDRLLRPALVAVAKAEPAQPAEAREPQGGGSADGAADDVSYGLIDRID